MFSLQFSKYPYHLDDALNSTMQSRAYEYFLFCFVIVGVDSPHDIVEPFNILSYAQGKIIILAVTFLRHLEKLQRKLLENDDEVDYGDREMEDQVVAEEHAFQQVAKSVLRFVVDV